MDVVQHCILSPAHLVFNKAAACGAAELAELNGVLDETLGVADERAGRLDRAVDAVAVVLVVLARRAERLAAAGAAEPAGTLAVEEVEVLGDLTHDGQARARVRTGLAAQPLGERLTP